ncbi:MAG TPA: hypothetical protein VIV11_19760 [Kofleriaceae bacterium]
MKRPLLALLIVMGCSKSSSSPPAESTPAPNQVSAIVTEMRTKLGAKDFYMAAAASDDAKPEDAKRIAGLVERQIIAAWDAVREAELANAKTLGVDRARGKSRDNCFACERFRTLLDQLSPHAPALAEKWQALKPELARAEQAAYDAETNDGRPRVLVRGDGDTALLVQDCAIEQLRALYPTYKFVEDYATSGSDPNAAAILITARSGSSTYVNSATRAESKLITGMQVVLVGHQLDKTLGKRFAKPLQVAHETYTPDQIESLAGPAEAEAAKVGMRKLEELREQLCKQLVAQLSR